MVWSTKVGREVIRNNVYNSFESQPFAYSTPSGKAAYRDGEETVDIDQVVGDWNNLLDHVIELISPGKKIARSGMKQFFVMQTSIRMIKQC